MITRGQWKRMFTYSSILVIAIISNKINADANETSLQAQALAALYKPTILGLLRDYVLNKYK